MAVVESRTSLWQALAGRPPGTPLAPSAPDIYALVADRLNPARARPVLRRGVEESYLTSVRGQAYVMLRSPGREAAYLRLAPEEVELAHLMDGTRTVAALVGDLARLTGRLAPEQVVRVVAELAGGRMLEELPVDAFRPLAAVHRRPLPVRIGRGLAAAAKGQRMVLGDVDRLASRLYRFGGFLVFTRVAAVLMVAVTLLGGALFARTWIGGSDQLFLTGDSYALGGLALLGINAFCLACHELGHALAAKHAGRRVPAAGVLLYFGIPSAFVDTTDVWMAGRRARLLTTAAGPAAALTLAGAAQVVALVQPAFGALAFKLAFAWYVNSLFNLNPLMALDGYYLLMDWLEVPNLRSRATAFTLQRARHRRFGWRGLDGEARILAMYGAAAALWLVISANLGIRTYKDRVGGLVAGLWRAGWPARVGLAAFLCGLLSPLVHATVVASGRAVRHASDRRHQRRRDDNLPARLDALRTTPLGRLAPEKLEMLARVATWQRPRRGAEVVAPGASAAGVLAVVEGELVGRRPADPPGSVRARAGQGELVGVAATLAGTASPLSWTAAGTQLLHIPAATFVDVVGLSSQAAPAERAEAEAVLDLPAFASLSEEDRLGLIGRMRPLDLSPGQAITAADAEHAAIVASGALIVGGDRELRRGDLLGPPAPGEPQRAEARSRARLWTVPAAAGLGLLLGTSAAAATPMALIAHTAPVVGVHGDTSYPPLAPPPGAPAGGDDGIDERLRRWFRRLLILLLLLALLSILLASPGGTAWAEIPDDHALLAVRRGMVEAVVDGDVVRLHRGDRVIVGRRDLVRVDSRAIGLLVFRGGAEAILCGGTRLAIGPLGSRGRDPVLPVAAVDLARGKVVVDTRAAPGAAFDPLALGAGLGRHRLRTDGEAQVSFSLQAVVVAHGRATLDGRPVTPSGQALTCGRAGGAPSTPGATASTATTAAPATSTSTIAPTTTPGPVVGPVGSPGSTATTSPAPTTTGTTATTVATTTTLPTTTTGTTPTSTTTTTVSTTTTSTTTTSTTTPPPPTTTPTTAPCRTCPPTTP